MTRNNILFNVLIQDTIQTNNNSDKTQLRHNSDKITFVYYQVIRVVSMEPRNKLQYKSYLHVMDVINNVLELLGNCVIRKHNQNIVMGLMYCFFKDYNNKYIKLAFTNVSDTF